MEQVFLDYLRSLNIPVSRKYFLKRVASHPDYPSLLSISDTLENLGISHGVARMDRVSLENLELPYVLRLDKDAGAYIVINKESDLKQREDIPEDWSGIVLKAEPVDELKDSENRRYLSQEQASRWGMSLFIASSAAMAAQSLWSSVTLSVLILLATAIAGTLLGYLLVAKDLGVKYDAVESFCNAGKSINCDRVLMSDEAKLFGRFSLSDAVLSYFSTQVIVVALLIPPAGNAAPLWWAITAVGILILPVVVYSLWLQGVKFKIWCRLCLLVAGVLVVQAGHFGWMVAADVIGLADGTTWAMRLVGGLFLAVGSLVFMIKSRLKEGTEAEQAMAAANRLKYNPSVFTHLLLQQPQADCTPFDKELLIGNSKNPIQITMAASLGCGPCKEGFEKAIQLVGRFPDLINFSVRLSVSKNDNGQESDPSRYILGYWSKMVYGTDNLSSNTEKLLQDWFELADLNRFQENYPLQVNGQSQELEILALQHSRWFEKAKIKSTPTFFINGYQLPEQYQLENLRYLVAGFSELFITDNDNIKKAIRTY